MAVYSPELRQSVRSVRNKVSGVCRLLSSQSVIRQLLQAHLVDRLSINLLPELLGGGSRLFDDGLPTSQWTLTSAHPDDTGAIWLLYDRKPASAEGELTVRRIVDATPDQAWTAFSDESLVRRWWGPSRFTCPRAEVDLRVGGAATVTMQAPPEFGGFQLHNRWHFHVVDKPTRIEYLSTFVDAQGNFITPAAAGVPTPGVPDEVHHVVTFHASGEGKTEIVVTERVTPRRQPETSPPPDKLNASTSCTPTSLPRPRRRSS